MNPNHFTPRDILRRDAVVTLEAMALVAIDYMQHCKDHDVRERSTTQLINHIGSGPHSGSAAPCAYRSPRGPGCCIVGAMISEETWQRLSQHCGLTVTAKAILNSMGIEDTAIRTFATRLQQNVHDYANSFPKGLNDPKARKRLESQICKAFPQGQIPTAVRIALKTLRSGDTL